jgi:hypothetical protein
MENSKKMEKWFVRSYLVALVAVGAWYYVNNKAHRDPTSEQAIEVLTAAELNKRFTQDPLSATAAFLDKVVQVKGQLSEIESNYVVLDDQVIAFFQDGHGPLELDQKVVINGRVTEYDDFFGQVKLDFVTIQ